MRCRLTWYLACEIFSDNQSQKLLLELSDFILSSTIGTCRNACVIWDSLVVLVDFEKLVEITANATRLLVKSNILPSSANNSIVPNTLVTFAQDFRFVTSLAGEPNSPWNDIDPRRLVSPFIYFCSWYLQLGGDS